MLKKILTGILDNKKFYSFKQFNKLESNFNSDYFLGWQKIISGYDGRMNIFVQPFSMQSDSGFSRSDYQEYLLRLKNYFNYKQWPLLVLSNQQREEMVFQELNKLLPIGYDFIYLPTKNDIGEIEVKNQFGLNWLQFNKILRELGVCNIKIFGERAITLEEKKNRNKDALYPVQEVTKRIQDIHRVIKLRHIFPLWDGNIN